VGGVGRQIPFKILHHGLLITLDIVIGGTEQQAFNDGIFDGIY